MYPLFIYISYSYYFISADDITGLHLSRRMCLDRLLVFLLAGGGRVETCQQSSCSQDFWSGSRGRDYSSETPVLRCFRALLVGGGGAFKLQSAFTLMKLDLMMKILHTDMSQTRAPLYDKYCISDYIISGDDQIIQTQSERFLSSYFNTLTLIFCSDRLSW